MQVDFIHDTRRPAGTLVPVMVTVRGRICGNIAVVDGDVVGEGDGFTDGEEVEIEIAVEVPIAVGTYEEVAWNHHTIWYDQVLDSRRRSVVGIEHME